MQPTDKFKVNLRERLADHFAQKSSVFSFNRKIVFSALASVLVVVIGIAAFFNAGPLSFIGGSKVGFVKAGGKYVPVNFPIKMQFQYDGISAEDLNKNFSSTPHAEGNVSYEKGILTFNQTKNLQYDTQYTLKVSKDASPKMEKDFELMFTTAPAARGDFFLSSRLSAAHYTLNYYDAKPQVFIQMPFEAEYKANLYKVSVEDLLAFNSATVNMSWDDAERASKDKKDPEAPLKKNLVDTQTIVPKVSNQPAQPDKFVYEPKVTDTGLYFVQFVGKPQTQYDQGVYGFFMTYSRYAVSTKRLGAKLVSWLVDMKTGEGVAGAEVKAYDKKNGVVDTAKTDDRGVASEEFAQNSQTPEKNPSVLVFNIGGEKIVNMINISYRSIFDVDWNNSKKDFTGYVMTDRPLYTPGDKVNFKAMIRKPNEPIYDGSAGKALVEVNRAYYGETPDVIFSHEYSVGSTGTFAGDFNLKKEMKTGDYTLNVTIGGKSVVTSTFGVEIYQKPEFEVSVSTDKDKYIAGDNISATVSANYFFGTPVKNQKVKVSLVDSYYFGDEVISKDATLDASGKATVVFEKIVVPQLQWWSDSTGGRQMSISATVNEDTGKRVSGSSFVTVFDSQYSSRLESPESLWNLQPRTDYSLVYRLTKSGEDSEMNGVADVPVTFSLVRQHWENVENAEGKGGMVEEPLVTDRVAKTDSFGKVSFDYNFALGGSFVFKFSYTDSIGNKVERTEYLWIYDTENGIFWDGAAQYGNQSQVSIMPEKEKYKLGETVKATVYLPQEAGDLYVSVNNTAVRKIMVNKISSAEEKIEIPVTEDLVPGFFIFAEAYNGDSFFSGSRFVEVTGKKLDVKVEAKEKSVYPKEKATLEVSVKDENGNPVATEGAISVVDKALLALRKYNDPTIFDAFYPRPSEYFMSRITSADAFSVGGAEKGGCFLSGTLITMADGTLKPIEDVKIGDKILTFQSEFSSKLVADEVVKTFEHLVGEYLIINGSLRVTPVHRILIDGDWKTAGDAKVGDWFIGSAGQKVEIKSVEKVLNNVKVYNFTTKTHHTYFANGIYVHNDKGGDARPRSKFVDAAYWNPYFETGSNGKGEVSFDVPDNLTTWVALTKNITNDTKVGEGEGEFLVTKDLFVRPALPLFARAGDELTLPATIQNNTANAVNAKILIKAEGATILDESVREVSVPANGSVLVSWKLKIAAEKKLKLAFSLSESTGKLVDNVENSLPIYPSLTLNKRVITGSTAGLVNFDFNKKGGVENFNNAQVVLTTSIVGILPEVIKQLTGYPYGCVEQTMTKHLPNILAKKYSKLLGITLPSDIDAQITAGFDRLQMYQHDDGAFGWWENDDASIWMTGYVFEGFTEIKKLDMMGGYEKMYDKTFEYLKKTLPNLKGDERVYANYVLAKAFPGGEYKLEITDEEVAKLSPEFQGYIALTHNLNGDKKEAARIINEFLMKTFADNHWEFTEGNVKDGHDWTTSDKYLGTGVALQALMDTGVGEESQIKAIVQWLMTHREGYGGLWGSTRQSSQVLFALLKFIQKYDEFNPDLQYALKLNGNALADGEIKGTKESKTIEIPYAKLSEKNALDVSFSGKGSLFYSIYLNTFDSAADIAESGGKLKIERKYLKGGATGKPANEFALGDVVNVELTVTGAENFRYLVVEDYLPAGFDIINERLQDAAAADDAVADADCRWCGFWETVSADIQDQKISFFDSYFWNGEKTIKFRARAARKGTFSVPAASVTPMYDPQSFDVSGEDKVMIQ